MRVVAALLVVVSCASADTGPNAGSRPVEPCPAGTHADGHACRPRLVLDCPDGTSFQAGRGCVAELAGSAEAEPPAPAPSPAPSPSTSSPLPEPAPSASTAIEAIGPCGCRAGDSACLLACGPRPPPLATASRSGAFDPGAAGHALVGAARAAQACRRVLGPTGPGTVVVVFDPSGVVQRAEVSPPYAGTDVGACVERTFMQMTIPSFIGPAVSVSKRFTVE